MLKRREGWILSAAICLNSGSSFDAGMGNASSEGHELLETMPDGKIRVLLTGLSRTKAEAMALILNSPEKDSRHA